MFLEFRVFNFFLFLFLLFLVCFFYFFFFFFSSRRRHTRWNCDWSSDVCSSDLACMSPRAPGRALRSDRLRLALSLGRHAPAPPRSYDLRMFQDKVVWITGASDRKSTRLNSSHSSISYAVFCLKKKKKKNKTHYE